MTALRHLTGSRDGLMVGGFGLVIAAVYFTWVQALPDSRLADAVGPGGLPRMYAVALGALAVLLIVQSLIAGTTGVAAAKPASPAGRACGMVAAGLFYVLIVPRLGYVSSIGLLIVVSVWIQGGGASGRVWLTAAAGAVLFWALFVWVLRVPQPSGWWSLLLH